MSELKSLDDLVAGLPRSDASGVVLDADGEPVPGADVFLYYERHIEGLRNRLAGRSKTNAEGRFHFVQSVVWEPIVERRVSISRPKYDVIAHHPARGMGFTVFLEGDPVDNLQVALMPATTFSLNVQNDSGQPVEGVRVRLYSLWSPDRPAWRRHEYHGAAIPEEAGIGAGLTDNNGAVKLDGPVTANFIAEKDGYCASFNGLNCVAGAPDFTKRRLDFTLKPSARVSGRVTGSDGLPVRGAAVWYMFVDRKSSQFSRCVTVTNQDGRYRFANVVPGDTTNSPSATSSLVAEDLRMGSNLVGVGEKISLRAGDEKTCDLRLAPGAVLAGQVVDEKTGKPVPRMSLLCSDIDEKGIQEPFTTDEQGRFRLLYPPGMEVTLGWNRSPQGTYLLSKEQLRQEAWRGALTGDVTGLTLKAKLLPVGTLQGVVLDLEGNPASQPHTVYFAPEVPPVHSGPDGRFTFQVARLDHDFDLFAVSPDRQGAALVRCPAGAASVTMRMGPVRDYPGRVATPEGASAGNLKFTLYLMLNGAMIHHVHQAVETDAEGRFIARGLHPKATYQALWSGDQGKTPGYDQGCVAIDLSTLTPGEPVTFEAVRFVNSLRGKVVDAQGNPVSDAQITLLHSGMRPRLLDNRFESDQHGAFTIERLAPGKALLAVGHPDYKSRKVEIDSDASDCVIQLNPRTNEFVGRVLVLDEAGAPIPNASVTVSTAVIERPLGKESSETQPLPIDAQGRGEFRMAIDRQEENRIYGNVIFCCDQPGCDLAYGSLGVEEEGEVVLQPRPSRDPWRGQVVDEAGRPVAGAQVEAKALRSEKNGPSAYISKAPGSSAVTDGDGRFVLSRISQESRPALRISAPGYVRLSTWPEMDEAPQTVFTLKPGGAISGKVVLKATGEPCAIGRVAASPRRGGASSEAARLASDGSFTIDGLPPGEYRLVLAPWSDEEPLRHLIPNHPPITVEAGKTATVTLEAEEGLPVRGKVVSRATGEVPPGLLFVAALFSEDRSFGSIARVQPDGSWHFYLAPGEYYLLCGVARRGGTAPLDEREQPIAIEKGKAYDNVVLEVK